MKIPDGESVYEGCLLHKVCEEIAAKAFAEHGIYVKVMTDVASGTFSYTSPPITEICFAIGDHRFDTAKELYKALENKAFL